MSTESFKNNYKCINLSILDMRKHPIVEFTKFVILITICATTENPVVIVSFLIMSLVISRGKLWFSSLWVFFVIWTVDVFTISEGVTFLGYRNFHLVTLEGVVYGLLMALRMVALLNIVWTMSKDIKADKIVIITSYLAPPLSLIISMTIRAVNRYSQKYKEIYYFHKAMEKEDVIHKVYVAIQSLSILVDWALENGMETSESMMGKKYGTARRTSYKNVRISRSDIVEIAVMLAIVILYVATKPIVYILPSIEINYSLRNIVIVCGICLYVIIEEMYEDRCKRDFV